MRRSIYDYFFLLVLGFVLYGFLKILSPFVGALLTAFMCAVTFYPITMALHRWFPRTSPSFRAAVTDLLVLVFFVTPLLLLGWAVLQESSSLMLVLKQGSTTVAQWRQGNVLESTPWMANVRFFLSRAFGVNRAEFQEYVISTVNEGLGYLSMTGGSIAKHVASFVLDLVIMLFALFFMIRDGKKLFHYLETLVPLRQQNKDEIAIRIKDTVESVARGLFLTSLVQGVLATIGYFMVGAEGAVLLGALTALMGLFPLVGTFGIWVPASLFFFFKGAYLKGLFLLLWGAFVIVGFTDAILRPYWVGKRVELPLFILFFALLGGAEVWGAKGILLGPILAAIAPILLHIYQQRFLRGHDHESAPTDVEAA